MATGIRKNLLFTIAVFLLIIIFGTVAVVAQQIQRDAADYPQVQLAEDTAASLNAGTRPSQLTVGHVDMNNSLTPFVIVYSKTGQAIAGNGYLDNRRTPPSIPRGVLTAASGKVYHFVTWQPEDGVRIAAVTIDARDYYVLSGRSLTEVEKDTGHTFWLSFIGGCCGIGILAVGYILSRKY
jgi:hypothetical protein